jgi:hypothetical protein
VLAAFAQFDTDMRSDRTRAMRAALELGRWTFPAPLGYLRPRRSDLDLPHDTLENLHEQRLVELVDLGDSDRGLQGEARPQHWHGEEGFYFTFFTPASRTSSDA